MTPVVGRLDTPSNTTSNTRGAAAAAAAGGRRMNPLLQQHQQQQPQQPLGEKEHGARIRDMVMRAAHEGYVEEDEVGGDGGGPAWRTPLASVDSLSRQLKDTWENFNANFAAMGEPRGVGGREVGGGGHMLPEY